jgi:hypothetical protein
VTTTSLVSVFASAVLPTLSLAVVGYALGRVKEVDVGPLNTVTLYVLAPALVFHSLVTTETGGLTVAKLFAGVTAFVLVMMALAAVVGRALGESGPLVGALVLASSFPNSGNLGIPLSEFAFGAVGRSTAVLFLTAQSVLVYTGGVFVAARTGGGETDVREALESVFRLPLVYAVAAAGVVVALGVDPNPEGTAMRTLELTGNAAIPLLLILLGVKLAGTDYRAALPSAGPGVALKLLVAPVVGVGLASLLSFENPTVARVFVLECAAPAAITPLMLTIEYGDRVGDALPITPPEYVGTLVLVTTVASVPALTVLIFLLQSGFVV